jgi:hypothetical protein
VSKTRRIVKRVCLPNASNVQVATKCAPGSPFLPPPWVYYDTLRFYDLPENAAVRIIGAIGTVHHLFPYAAGPYVHLLDSGCEAFRSPPMHDIVRIGHCFPDKFARASSTRVITISRLTVSIVSSISLMMITSSFKFSPISGWGYSNAPIALLELEPPNYFAYAVSRMR